MTREEAIELLDILPLCNECDSRNFPYTCAECGDAYLLAMEALKQPEIVLCKDCKHGVKSPTFRYYPEITWCNQHSTSHNDNWYCADGERKQ